MLAVFNRRMWLLRPVTEFAARSGLAVASTSVAPASDQRMSLVSMANSDRISKRPILPAAKGVSARTRATPRPQKFRRAAPDALAGHRSPAHLAFGPWRDRTWLLNDSGQARVSEMFGDRPALPVRRERPGQTPARRQPSAARAARISTSHSWRNSVAPAPSSSAVATSSAAHRTW